MNRIFQIALLALLRGYKWALSPLFPPACRYVPTCSEYAVEAIERRGAVRGTAMAIWRLLRCHPFAKGGFDPVPVEPNFARPESRGRLSSHEHHAAIH